MTITKDFDEWPTAHFCPSCGEQCQCVHGRETTMADGEIVVNGCVHDCS